MTLKIYFEDAGGYEAEIIGDEAAIRTIEKAFEKVGFKMDETTQTWIEECSNDTPF